MRQTSKCSTPPKTFARIRAARCTYHLKMTTLKGTASGRHCQTAGLSHASKSATCISAMSALKTQTMLHRPIYSLSRRFSLEYKKSGFVRSRRSDDLNIRYGLLSIAKFGALRRTRQPNCRTFGSWTIWSPVVKASRRWLHVTSREATPVQLCAFATVGVQRCVARWPSAAIVVAQVYRCIR